MKIKQLTTRYFILILLLFIFSALCSGVYAEYEVDLCIHHPFHTQECGYIEGTNGQECLHIHSEECGGEENCLHEHNENCEYIEAIQASPCQYSCEFCDNVDNLEPTEIENIEKQKEEKLEFSAFPILDFNSTSGIKDFDESSDKIEIILRKIEESYNIYGILPPFLIQENRYLSGIAPMAFITGTIPKEEFEINGLSEELIQNFNSSEFEYSYRADGEAVSADKFPDFEDKNYRFVNVTVEGVPALRLGIIEMEDGSIYYYYLTVPDRNSGISATILPGNEKFQINYKPNEYSIEYEVILPNEKVINNANPEETIIHSKTTLKTTISLDSIFGIDRAVVTNDLAYSFNVTIPYYYTGEVWRYKENNSDGLNLINYYSKNPSSDGESFYPLGTDPEYHKVGNTVLVNTSNCPNTLTWSETFFDNDVDQNRRIVVKLSEKDAPNFSANYWLHTDYAGGGNDRGTTAKSIIPDPSNANLVPAVEESWDWNYLKNKSDSNDRKPQDMTLEDSGYSYTWVFQTNSGAGDGGYFLDTLEINGIHLEIPLFPAEIGSYRMDENGEYIPDNNGNKQLLYRGSKGSDDLPYPYEEARTKESIKTTPLTDGAIATVEYVRVFYGGNPSNQRVYKVTVTGAKANVTITGGNLFQFSSGAPEFVTYSLVGVNADDGRSPSINRDFQTPAIQFRHADLWKDAVMSVVIINGKDNGGMTLDDSTAYGDSSKGNTNIRFKLSEGYKDPVYTWADKNGEEKEFFKEKKTVTLKNDKIPANYLDEDNNANTNTIYGPDSDGWYYIRIEMIPTDNKDENYSRRFMLLSVEATPIKYMLHYLNNETTIDDSTMPSFDHSSESNPAHTFIHAEEDWGPVSEEEKLRYDDGNGLYYDIVANRTIAIHPSIPQDLTHTKEFTGWLIVDEDNQPILNKNGEEIIITPGMGIDLDTINEYTVVNEELGGATEIQVIRLLAQWKDNPNYFEYNVSLVWESEENNGTYESLPLQRVETKNLIETGEALEVAVNTEDKTFINWLSQHPYYCFDSEKNTMATEDEWTESPYVNTINKLSSIDEDDKDNSPEGNYKVLGGYRYKVTDNGTIYIYMKKANGALPIQKQVEGIPGYKNGGEETFEFEITTSNSDNIALPEGIYYAWPSSEINSDVNAIPLKFVKENNSSKALFTLRGNESITLYIPPGNYTVTEKSGSSFKYNVEIDNILYMENGNFINPYTSLSTSRDVIVGEITNLVTYKNSVQLTTVSDYPIIKKELKGENIPNRTFSFTLRALEDYGEAIEILDANNTKAEIDITIPEASNTGTGRFKGVTFKQIGIYRFLIKENSLETSEGYYVANPSSYIWTVKVVNENGQLKISEDTKKEFSFINNYIENNPKVAQIPIEVGKFLYGRNLIAGEFNFTLSLHDSNSENVIIPISETTNTSAQNGQRASVNFGRVEISEPGTYTFEIRETKGNSENIIYDEKPILITYEVTRDQNGNLSYSEPTFDNKIEFVNYTFINDTLNIGKEFRSINSIKDWEAKYNFKANVSLVNCSSTKSPMVDEENFGNYKEFDSPIIVEFSKENNLKDLNLRFLEPGVYTFLVEEEIPQEREAGISYDTSKYLVTYIVEDLGGELVLSRNITDEFYKNVNLKDNKIIFVNEYRKDLVQFPIEAHKIFLDSNENKIQLEDYQFSFILRNTNNSNDTQVVNAPYGSIAFTHLEFDTSDIGKTFNYTLSEISGNLPEITYDPAIYNIVLTIESTEEGLKVRSTITKDNEIVDNIVFTNHRDIVEIPEPENPDDPELEVVPTGNLKISKTVTGAGEKEKDFNFIVTLDNKNINGDYGELTFENGVAQFTLRDGKVVTALGLPQGTTYEVIEKEANQNGYKTTASNNKGTIPLDDTIETSFTNHKELVTEDKDNEILDILISKEQQSGDSAITESAIIVTRENILSYYIKVTNPNAQSVHDITISDAIPKGLNVIESSISNNGSLSNEIINWNISELRAHEEVALTFNTVVSNNSIYTKWSNKAIVNWRENVNIQAKETNTVIAYTPVITIEKEQSTSKITNIPRTKDYIEFKPGDIATYYLTIKNITDIPATDILVSDYIPKELTLLDKNAATTGMIVEGNYFYWPIKILNPGEELTFQVSFQLPELITEKMFIKNIGYVTWKENGNNVVSSNEVIMGDPPSEELDSENSESSIPDPNDPPEDDNSNLGSDEGPNELSPEYGNQDNENNNLGPDSENSNLGSNLEDSNLGPDLNQIPNSNDSNSETLEKVPQEDNRETESKSTSTITNNLTTTQTSQNYAPKTGIESYSIILLMGIIILTVIVLGMINVKRR